MIFCKRKNFIFRFKLGHTRVANKQNILFHILNDLVHCSQAHFRCRHLLCIHIVRAHTHFECLRAVLFSDKKLIFKNLWDIQFIYEFHINSSGQFLILNMNTFFSPYLTSVFFLFREMNECRFHGASVTKRKTKELFKRHENKLFVCHIMWLRISVKKKIKTKHFIQNGQFIVKKLCGINEIVHKLSVANENWPTWLDLNRNIRYRLWQGTKICKQQQYIHLISPRKRKSNYKRNPTKRMCHSLKKRTPPFITGMEERKKIMRKTLMRMVQLLIQLLTNSFFCAHFYINKKKFRTRQGNRLLLVVCIL